MFYLSTLLLRYIPVISSITKRCQSEVLSNIYRRPIEDLSNIYRRSIEHLSKTYRRPIEHLSNIYRRPIEDLSKAYRVNHTAIIIYTPTLFVCCTLFPKLHGLDIRTRRDGEEINSRREGRERDTLRRASSNIVETNRRETCAVSRTERDRDIRSISKER